MGSCRKKTPNSKMVPFLWELGFLVGIYGSRGFDHSRKVESHHKKSPNSKMEPFGQELGFLDVTMVLGILTILEKWEVIAKSHQTRKWSHSGWR